MPRAARAALAGCVVMGVALATWRWNPWQGLTLAGIRDIIIAWGPLGPLVYMALVIGGSFVPAPELLMVATGSILFGPLWGFVYAWTAAMVGTTAVFLLVRRAAQEWAQRALRHRFPRLRALDHRLHHNGFALVAVLRVILFLAPPLSWALGASRVRLVDHVLGTAVGILPMMALAVVFAHRLGAVGSIRDLLEMEVLLPGVALVLLIVLGLVLGRRLLAGPSAEAPERKPDGRPAGQHAAIEGGEHRRRRTAPREA